MRVHQLIEHLKKVPQEAIVKMYGMDHPGENIAIMEFDYARSVAITPESRVELSERIREMQKRHFQAYDTAATKIYVGEKEMESINREFYSQSVIFDCQNQHKNMIWNMEIIPVKRGSYLEIV